MICRSAGSPATARSSHSRQASASSRYPAASSACRVRWRRAASSSGSPSCAARRAVPAARWWAAATIPPVGCVGQRLERDQRAPDRVAVRARRRSGTLATTRSRRRTVSCSASFGVDRAGAAGARLGDHVRTNGTRSPACDGEVGDRGSRRCALRSGAGGAQPHRVRTGDRDRGLVARRWRTHGHDAAVVEPQPQLAVHLHAAAERPRRSARRRPPAARRHEVDDPDRAARGLPLGLQDQRVVAVAPPGAVAAAGRGQPPVSGVGRRRAARRSRRASRSAAGTASRWIPSRPTSAAVCRSPMSA